MSKNNLRYEKKTLSVEEFDALSEAELRMRCNYLHQRIERLKKLSLGAVVVGAFLFGVALTLMRYLI